MFSRYSLMVSTAAVAVFSLAAAVPAAAGHAGRHHHAYAKHHHGHQHGHHHGHHRHAGHHHKHCKMHHVGKSLHARGFVTWDEIEWDDGVWEVDDARRADGSQYDLKLHPKTLKIIHSRRER